MAEDRKRILSVTLADCEVDTYRASGAGGQKRNKTSSAVRVRHLPSGAVGNCSEHRSQYRNKRTAFIRMTETKEFKLWLRLQLGHIDAERAELERRVQNQVERDLRHENLLWEFGQR